MSESLQKILRNEFGNKGIKEEEIPSFVKENLSKELRDYQEEALKYYFANLKLDKKRHLMFNMATGSGKTLIMAALMLECYERGYRNFIFFVNSASILEKTKANFADASSSKYLFKENILIDSSSVEINVVHNLLESKNECINLYFTTIQALFSLFKNERENALTFEDLKDKKLVFLADEAHHLNSDTKSKSENELKEGWETIIKKAYESNDENLLFEFSATIPQEKNVLDKYKDKIIYEYALKEFCQNGYSKRIFLVKYDNDSLEFRFLGALLCSLYRELLAQKKGFGLKPVILFKSESIKESLQNQEKFIHFVENLEAWELEEFYKNIDKDSEILSKSLEFFKREYKDLYASVVIKFLKNNFKPLYILNTNDDKELEKKQILLNSLEDKENEKRVIFCVDKLNEGWDVLNLFDIVRLSNKKTSKTITTKETQLIGRGARYCPFGDFDDELKFKRKFDKDLDNEWSALEKLSYHTRNDVEFIKNLNEDMIKQGLLFEEEKERVLLAINEEVKNITQKHGVYYVSNKRIKKRDLKKEFSPLSQDIKDRIRNLEIPYFSNSIKEIEEKFEKMKEENDAQEALNLSVIDNKYFLKAMNVLGIHFKDIRSVFDFESKEEFLEKYLKNIEVKFSKKQEFNLENSFKIAKYVLEKYKALKQNIEQEFEVTEFEAKKMQDIENRSVFKDKDKFKEVDYKWFYHKTFCWDSALEKEFIRFVASHEKNIDRVFSRWFILRNEGFKEFKIYNNQKDKDYAKGFEPDFIFFGKKNENEDFLSIQCFIEAKGEHLVANDAWKEDFLKALRQEIPTKEGKKLRLNSMPFFTISKKGSISENFEKEFRKFFLED